LGRACCTSAAIGDARAGLNQIRWQAVGASSENASDGCKKDETHFCNKELFGLPGLECYPVSDSLVYMEILGEE